MRTFFVDTNIFLRHLLNDDSGLSPKALAIIQAIERGEIEAWTSDLVIAELVFVLSSRRTYSQTREVIAAQLLPLISLPHLKLPSKRLLSRAFHLYVTEPIDFIDAYNAALLEQRKKRDLLSFDTDFDRVPTVDRFEAV